MNDEKSYTYPVAPGLCLTLENLLAEVSISVGEENTASVKMTGNEKLLKDIKVSQPDPKNIQIKGGSTGGNNVTVVSGSNRQSITVRGGGGIIITGSGGMVSVGDLVVMNGKVISGGGNTEVIEGEIPKIQVVVPKGTDLEIYDVEKVDAKGLGGKLSSHVSGQKELKVVDVNGLKVKCSGQSNCYIKNAAGNAKLTASGQSSIDVQGDLGDVEADTSGQSDITINGNCHDFEGEASGQSDISVSGKATGRVRQRESGQSSVSVH